MNASKLYLEAKNTADKEQHDEDQAHVTESGDLLFVGEVIRLQRGQKELVWSYRAPLIRQYDEPLWTTKKVGIRLLGVTDFTCEVSYQLLQIILYCVRVNHNADSDQGIESKVKYLVAEEWDDPGGTQLKQRYLF